MKNFAKGLLSLLLCFCLIVSFYLSMMAFFVKLTILNESFYQQVITSPTYLSLLKDSINDYLLTKSNFTAIPMEHLQVGLDDQLINVKSYYHIQNVVATFNYQQDYQQVDYPDDVFYESLVNYLNFYAGQEGFIPEQEQFDLLQEVAEDSAEIVEYHLNVINLDLVKNLSEFKKINKLLFKLSQMAFPALIVFLFFSLVLLLVHLRDLSRGLLYLLSSIWLAASTIFVPALVTVFYKLPQRLAIDTAYLKYLVDQLLAKATRFILLLSLAILLLSTLGLIIRFFRQPFKKFVQQKD